MKQKKKRTGSKQMWTALVLVLLCTLAISTVSFAANSVMKNKKWVSGQGGTYLDTDKDGKKDTYQSAGKTYYKLQIPKQGYIVVDVKTSQLPGEKEYNDYLNEDGEQDVEEDASTTVELLNSQKKPLAQKGNFFSGKNSFVFTATVKKGTYYLTTEGNQKYKLRYTFTSVPKVNKAGKSLKSAVSWKKGVTVKNLLSADKSHYYKIKLTKKSKVTLSFNASVRDTVFDGMNVQILVKKGKNYRTVNNKGKLIAKNKLFYWEVVGKDKISATLPKGTYYIRTWTLNGSGGYYTMKWK